MSEPIVIKSHRHDYTLEFVTDPTAALAAVRQPEDHVIVDEAVLDAHPAVGTAIDGLPTTRIVANEDTKSFRAVAPIIAHILERRFTKNNRLIAIGGGVTQDVTAFIASILFRGVDWLFLPTTLLTQCDSCIGSKTSINFGTYKNQLGSFFPPRQIFVDLTFLSTLPIRQIDSGLGEMLHYFLVDGEDSFAQFERDVGSAHRSSHVLESLIVRSLQIKQRMIELDEFDRGPRNVFNYGHSFGHALESATAYTVPHGIAVAYGMDLANILSADAGLLPMAVRNRVRSTCSEVWTRAPLSDIPLPRYFEALSRDKKNVGGRVNVILTKGIGEMFKTELPEGAQARITQFFEDKLYEAPL